MSAFKILNGKVAITLEKYSKDSNILVCANYKIEKDSYTKKPESASQLLLSIDSDGKIQFTSSDNKHRSAFLTLLPGEDTNLYFGWIK